MALSDERYLGGIVGCRVHVQRQVHSVAINRVTGVHMWFFYWPEDVGTLISVL